MKKLFVSLCALAALSAGSAFAQSGSAECQAGAAYGTPPGCGNQPHESPLQNNPGVLNGIHQYPGAQQGRGGYYDYGAAGALGAILGGVLQPQYQYPNQRIWVDPNTGARYAYGNRTERDHDGDGVRNNRDRYPNDPRYR